MNQSNELFERVSPPGSYWVSRAARYLFLVIVLVLAPSLAAACANKSTAETSQNLMSTRASEEGMSDEIDPSLPGGGEGKSAQGGDSQGEQEQGTEVTPVPNGTPEVEKEIVLCLGSPPTSLFVYGDSSATAVSLRQALYEKLYTTVGYDYQPRGLEKLPNLQDGDAYLEKIMVGDGQRVSDSNGNVVTLRQGVQVIDANGQVVSFDGTPVEMEQMVADFRLEPMYWSDGTPVTANDSVFSFELAADPQTTVSKENVATTAGYEAIDDLTVRWIGIPGYRDQTYFLNVWEPVPSHALSGMGFEELIKSEEVNRTPLANGPFIVSSWNSDLEVVLVRNEQYYRLDQGLPFIDRLIVRFGNGEEFLAGDSSKPCDVIGNGALNPAMLPLLEMSAKQSEWELLSSPGTVYEQLAFGIDPVEEYASRRPDWFEDKRVRQAIAMCIDRQRMVEELTGGRAEMLHAYVSNNHPLFPNDAQKWSYDPDGANALLDEAGYVDFAGDGRRQDVSSGIPMTITLGTNRESSLRLNITVIVQENLAECGIPIETYAFSAGTWFAEGPVGRLFGRQFDLAEFAWTSRILPDCSLYESDNITGPIEAGFGGWQDSNVTGWSNEDFDNACENALQTMRGGDGYEEYQREALRVFSDELPAVPLFTNVKVAAARPWMKNLAIDPSERSLLWNIAEWDVEK